MDFLPAAMPSLDVAIHFARRYADSGQILSKSGNVLQRLCFLVLDAFFAYFR